MRRVQARARAAQADPRTPEPDPNMMAGYDDRPMDDDRARFVFTSEDCALWLASPVAAHPGGATALRFWDFVVQRRREGNTQPDHSPAIGRRSRPTRDPRGVAPPRRDRPTAPASSSSQPAPDATRGSALHRLRHRYRALVGAPGAWRIPSPSFASRVVAAASPPTIVGLAPGSPV